MPAVELDPSELDRLLAEFDPDVQPLLDDDVYRQFLEVGGRGRRRRRPGHWVGGRAGERAAAFWGGHGQQL
jgi:hypothetical protein